MRRSMLSDGTNDHDFWFTAEAVYYNGCFFEPVVRDTGLTYQMVDTNGFQIEGWSQPVSMAWDLDCYERIFWYWNLSW